MIAQDKTPDEAPRSRAEIAYDAAAAAIETLLYSYWADSFQEKRLEQELAVLIARHTTHARFLSEPHPHPESLLQEVSDHANSL